MQRSHAHAMSMSSHVGSSGAVDVDVVMIFLSHIRWGIILGWYVSSIVFIWMNRRIWKYTNRYSTPRPQLFFLGRSSTVIPHCPVGPHTRVYGGVRLWFLLAPTCICVYICCGGTCVCVWIVWGLMSGQDHWLKWLMHFHLLDLLKHDRVVSAQPTTTEIPGSQTRRTPREKKVNDERRKRKQENSEERRAWWLSITPNMRRGHQPRRLHAIIFYISSFWFHHKVQSTFVVNPVYSVTQPYRRSYHHHQHHQHLLRKYATCKSTMV